MKDELLKIGRADLRELIKDRKKYIKTNATLLSAICSFAAFIVSVAMCDFLSLAIFQKALISIAAIFYIAIIVITFPRRYSVEAFIRDIEKLSKTHEFSLILLKDTSMSFPRKYILCNDKRWNTWLFPYTRSVAENNDESIKNYLLEEFGITDFEIAKTEKTTVTKYSVSSDMQKTYTHTFYLIKFDATKTALNKKSFKLNGSKYKWFSIDEMKRNSDLINKNKETVTFVESHF